MGKHGPEKTPYLDTFHAVERNWNIGLIIITLLIKTALLVSEYANWLKTH